MISYATRETRANAQTNIASTIHRSNVTSMKAHGKRKPREEGGSTFKPRRGDRGSGDGSHVTHGRPYPRRFAQIRGVDGRRGGDIAAGAPWIGGGEGRGGGGEG
jgi:hypothetical protein